MNVSRNDYKSEYSNITHSIQCTVHPAQYNANTHTSSKILHNIEFIGVFFIDVFFFVSLFILVLLDGIVHGTEIRYTRAAEKCSTQQQ